MVTTTENIDILAAFRMSDSALAKMFRVVNPRTGKLYPVSAGMRKHRENKQIDNRAERIANLRQWYEAHPGESPFQD